MPKNAQEFICEECCKTKSTVKRPFDIGPIADKSVKNPGDLIHSDIAGPEIAYNNKNYVINFIDEISGLVNVQFMKSKSEVPNMIKEGLKEMRILIKLPAPDRSNRMANLYIKAKTSVKC